MTAPLRKVVCTEVRSSRGETFRQFVHRLECGHLIRGRRIDLGPSRAKRMRCWDCGRAAEIGLKYIPGVEE
ncbi:hypothetical protein LCGC14_1030690 [marine sediment metagenome]|uniref:Uncharacterized protein n=1 Tax=marine sediment metagenome TaxID=412755 RepID=A0A0F9R0L3_9ZZZZ